ncbi:hypothetical protein J4450_07370 [Candidatus Micrarchaeota archaeon]|nr:hypothetical protein [Candidatus Micrarchaeota archaeon]
MFASIRLTRFEILERTVQQERARSGLIGSFTSLKPLTDKVEGERTWKQGGNVNIMAHTSLMDWAVEIFYREGWRPGMTVKSVSELLRDLRLKPDNDDIVLVHAASRHEFGHNRKCPTSLGEHIIIMQAVSEGVIAALNNIIPRAGHDIIIFKELIEYLTNAFEDLIDNTGSAIGSRSTRAGLAIFYAMQVPYSPFFKAFVNLNLAGWAGEEERRFLGPALTIDNIDDKYKQESENLSNQALVELFALYQLNKTKIARKLMLNSKNWPEFAKAFAEYLAPLVFIDRCNGGIGRGGGKPLFAIDGSDDFKGVGESGTGFGNNPFQDAFDNDPDARKKALNEAFGWGNEDEEGEDGGQGGRFGKGMGQAGEAIFMDLDERLRIWYELNAPEIGIVAQGDASSSSLPLIRFDSVPFEPSTHRISDIRGLSIRDARDVGRGLTLELDAYADRLSFPISAPTPFEGFMDLGLICDCSGSMHGGGSHALIPWGDASPFHFVLLGLNGSLKYLSLEDILPYINVNFTFFSDATISSGWADYSGLTDAKRFACRPQFGGTEIDMRVIRKQYANRKPAVVLFITDTQIYNWSSISRAFIEVMKSHRVFVFRTGPETEQSRDMKKAGFQVIPMEYKRDIEHLLLDATRYAYEKK